MKISRRSFLKRVAGVSALVAVPSLGVAKTTAKKPLKLPKITAKEILEVQPMSTPISAEDELANQLAQEMADEIDKEIINAVNSKFSLDQETKTVLYNDAPNTFTAPELYRFLMTEWTK